VSLRNLTRWLLAGLVGLAGGALLAPAGPAAAAGAARLSVAVASDPATPGAGHRVAYRIQVRNTGAVTAAKVSVDFITSAPLTSPAWTVSAGRCLRSPAETACLFGTLKPGASAWATISGILAKNLAPGTRVTNTVTLASDTALAEPAQAVVHADYTTPGGVPTAPGHAPSTAATGGGSGVAAQGQPAKPALSPLWVIPPAALLVGAGLALVLLLRGRRRTAG